MKEILSSWYGVIAGSILSEESKNAKYHISYIICCVLVGKKGKKILVSAYFHTHKRNHVKEKPEVNKGDYSQEVDVFWDKRDIE